MYEFETEEITGTIDLVNWLDFYGGKKSGVDTNAQGAQDNPDQKVGIFFGNLQQMADRLGLYNKSYREAHLGLGLRHAFGLANFLTEKEAVKIIGEAGAEWEDLTSGEAKKAPDLDIDLSGGSAEVQANAAKSQKRENALLMIGKDPLLRQSVNPQWYLGEILKSGYMEESEIKVALSKDAGNLEMISDASNAIQEILKGKKPKLRRTATTAFINYIVNFAQDEEVKMDQYKALMDYAKAHLKIATDNAVKKAREVNIANAERGGQQEEGRVNITDNLSIPEPRPGVNPGIQGNRATSLMKGVGLPQ